MSSPTVCPVCEGSGWKEVAGAEERRVTRCDCVLASRSARLLEQARIPARYEHCELSNFDTRFPGGGPSLAAALLHAEKFAEEYPLENTGLLLIGPIGVGKTHLAVGILKELITQKGVPVLFYDYRELLKQIQNSYNATVQTTEMEVLRPVFETEVLVLDELGAVKPTDWVWDTVSHILNTRYNNKRTTIISTNFKDLPAGGGSGALRQSVREETLGDRIGERMRSRLHEMCKIIKMDGDDFRQTWKRASWS